MPLAVTHVLTSIILVDLYRDYITKHKKYFTLHTIFIAGFAGLLPDIDILLNKFLGLFGAGILHRTFTHTTLFALIFLIPAFIYWKLDKKKISVYFIVTTFGIILHLLLDFIFTVDGGHGIMFLYPFSQKTFELGLLSSYGAISFAGLDAIILLLWLWHEEKKHKISDFI
jgi:membrane-bound metal-dependent hydrolase YbcI (DUF457 family)